MKAPVFFVERSPIVKEYPGYIRVINQYMGRVTFRHIKANTKRAIMYSRTQTLDIDTFNLCYDLANI